MEKNKWEICPECEGEGTVLCESMRGIVYSSLDFEDDPDFSENYFSGQYDVTCDFCNGTGKVLQGQERQMRVISDFPSHNPDSCWDY